jgi:hypothetical protein
MDYTELAKQYGGAVLNSDAPPPTPPPTSSATIPPPSAPSPAPAPAATNYADLAKQYGGTVAAPAAQAGPIPATAISTIVPSQPPPSIPDSSSFASRLGEDWQQRWSNIKDIHQRNVALAEQQQAGNFTPLGAQALNQVNELGQAVSAFTVDPINQTLISAWNTLTPEEFKQWLADKGNAVSQTLGTKFNNFQSTAIGHKFINALSKGYDSTATFLKRNPEIGETVESLFAFSLIPLEKIAATEAKNIVSDVSSAALIGVKPATRATSANLVNRRLSIEIRDRLQRSVEFFQSGSKTQSARAALDKSESAVKDLISNKSTFNLTDMNYKQKAFKLPEDPKTAIFDTMQIIEQRQKQYGPAIEAALDNAKAANSTIDPAPAIAAIRAKMQEAALIGKSDSPAIIKAGEKIIKNYEQNGPLELRTAHEMLQAANEVGGIPSKFDIKVKSLEDAGINAIRDSFYQKIDPAGADALRRWGELQTFKKGIESQVQTKLEQAGFKYSQIYATVEAMKVAVTGHAGISALAATRGVQDIEKAAKATGNQLVKMFRNGSSLMEKQAVLAEPFTPSSKIVQTIQNIMSRGGKQSELIDALKAFGVSEPKQIANELRKQLRLAGPKPRPALPAPPGPEPGVTMRAPGEVYSPYSPELARQVRQPALPPGQGFTAPGLNAEQSTYASQINPNPPTTGESPADIIFRVLGGKKMMSVEKGSITAAERRRIAEQTRGMTRRNR